jgi:hypothetical protein
MEWINVGIPIPTVR